MKNKVEVDCITTVEVSIGTVSITDTRPRSKYLSYGDVHKMRYFVTTDLSLSDKIHFIHIHPESFIGRAILGISVEHEVEVNVGGLSIEEMRIGYVSGNHLKLKVLSVQ